MNAIIVKGKTHYVLKDITAVYFIDKYIVVESGNTDCVYDSDEYKIEAVVYSDGFDKKRMIPFISLGNGQKEMCREFEMRNYAFKDII